jgi:hypothetical protein
VSWTHYNSKASDGTDSHCKRFQFTDVFGGSGISLVPMKEGTAVFSVATDCKTAGKMPALRSKAEKWPV